MVEEINKDMWNFAQVGELDWHKNNNWRADDWNFILNTQTLFDALGYHSRNAYANKYVLDVGAGPRLRTKFWKDVILYAIEPLGKEYMDAFYWCDLLDSVLYTKPIEEFIPELENKFDFIISINALDHCYNFSDALENIKRYVKKEGEILLSYDCHTGNDPLHPLGLNIDISIEYLKRCGLSIVGEGWKTNPYGLGEYSINYWLSK